MAFTILHKSARGRGPEARTNRVSIYKSAKQGCANIAFTPDVAAAANFALGQYVSIAIGSGEDDGWVAVTRADDGFKLTRIGGKTPPARGYRIGCGAFLRHVKSVPTSDCKFVVKDGEILFQIPDRLRGSSAQLAA